MRDASELSERRYVARGELKAVRHAISEREKYLLRAEMADFVETDSRLAVLRTLESSLVGEINAINELLRTGCGADRERSAFDSMMRGRP